MLKRINPLELMDQPFFIYHEFYRMYFERAMAMKEEREKQEKEEEERRRQQAKEERAAHRNRGSVAAYDNTKQTPPSPSLPPIDVDDLEEMIEEVM